jgi:hypothetical protein
VEKSEDAGAAGFGAAARAGPSAGRCPPGFCAARRALAALLVLPGLQHT